MGAVIVQQIPNALTVLRVLLIVPLVTWFYSGQYLASLICFIVIGLSDGLDGLLARRFGWTSRFGSIADPLADKLTMLVSYFMLFDADLIPGWLWGVVIGRDIVIISGGLAYYWVKGPYEMAPSLISKSNTALQLLLVVTVLFSVGVVALPAAVLQGLFLLVLLSSLSSGLLYVWVWGRKAL